MNQNAEASGVQVRISLGGEHRTVGEAEWKRVADEMVARHGGVPSVVVIGRPHFQDGGGVPAPQPAALAPVIIAPPAAPARPVKRGSSVDIEGALRSHADRDAAEAAGFAPQQPLYTRGTMVVDLGVENARRSRLEHDAKPLVKEYCANFVEKIRQEDRQDTVFPTTSLRMTEEGRIRVSMEDETMLLTSRALSSMTNRLGFGGASYLEKCWPKLRAMNFNQWGRRLEQAESARLEAENADRDPLKKPVDRAMMKLRHRKNGDDREVYGAVTESYAAFDVDKIAEALALATPPDARGTVTYDGYRARFEVMFHSNVVPEKYVAGEFFKAGVIISTEDTGGASITGRSTVFQNLCLNLIVIDRAEQPIFKLKHIGSVELLADRFRAGFKRALGTIDHFLKAWNYAVEEDVVKEVRQVEKEPLPADNREIMKGIFNALLKQDRVLVPGRRSVVVPKLMQMWEKDTSAAAGFTRAAVVNAFTRYAHEEPHEDPWTEDAIQIGAGQLLYGRKDGQTPPVFPYEPLDE